MTMITPFATHGGAPAIGRTRASASENQGTWMREMERAQMESWLRPQQFARGARASPMPMPPPTSASASALMPSPLPAVAAARAHGIGSAMREASFDASLGDSARGSNEEGGYTDEGSGALRPEHSEAPREREPAIGAPLQRCASRTPNASTAHIAQSSAEASDMPEDSVALSPLPRNPLLAGAAPTLSLAAVAYALPPPIPPFPSQVTPQIASATPEMPASAAPGASSQSAQVSPRQAAVKTVTPTPTLAGAPNAQPLPWHVHIESGVRGHVAWIALRQSDPQSQRALALIAAEVQRVLTSQGKPLVSVICNGQSIWEAPTDRLPSASDRAAEPPHHFHQRTKDSS